MLYEAHEKKKGDESPDPERRSSWFGKNVDYKEEWISDYNGTFPKVEIKVLECPLN